MLCMQHHSEPALHLRSWAQEFPGTSAKGTSQGAVVQASEVLLVCALGPLYATQMFHCTGHFSEFAGLHYTAGALP